jgi:YMGG-like Gly-zipper
VIDMAAATTLAATPSISEQREASMHIWTLTVVMASAIGVATPVAAQQPIAYPSKGQSSAQQSQDSSECTAWARQNTGIDPMQASAPPPQASSGPRGERVGGAARGAAGGAVVGAITGDAGEGAAVGAVVGTMAGGRRARQNRRAADDAAQAQQSQALNTYYRAFGACMEAKGYAIK